MLSLPKCKRSAPKGDALSKRSAPKGKLTNEEQEEVIATRIKLPEAKIFTELRAKSMAEGKAEGARENALAAARKMLEHGISWDIITDSTGIRSGDLKKAAAAPKAKPAKK